MVRHRVFLAVLLCFAGLLSACASLESLVEPPGVTLRNVEVQSLDLSEQSFLLSFDVTNPNPFPLPINSISYAVELDGHRFASGSTTSEFTVAAGSDSEFAISVDLNLLSTAPELLFVIRDAVRRDIPYSLEGRLGIDLPYARPVTFRTDGLIRLHAGTF
ncbi:MAG: LEA type 2 family protein [Woeseiaceae bacterium]|nr:LEA type 2 family protein [Woeseiaceae bacterium]